MLLLFATIGFEDSEALHAEQFFEDKWFLS